jgi:hypothetical protein
VRYIIRPRSVRSAVAGLASTLAMIAAAPISAAAAPCPSSPTSQAFSRFGDSALYSPVAGGSFESGAPGWSLTSAGVTSGNESYNLVSGSHSLAIQPQGVAVSPPLCVSDEYPSFRFFARQTSGSWAVLNVIVRWSDSSGSHETTSGSLQTGTSWSASPVMKLGSMLPVQSGPVTVRLVFAPEHYGGAWAIDDVFVDPYRR